MFCHSCTVSLRQAYKLLVKKQDFFLIDHFYFKTTIIIYNKIFMCLFLIMKSSSLKSDSTNNSKSRGPLSYICYYIIVGHRTLPLFYFTCLFSDLCLVVVVELKFALCTYFGWWSKSHKYYWWKYFDAAVWTAATSKQIFFLNSEAANKTSSIFHYICKLKCATEDQMVICDLAMDEANPWEGNDIVENQRIFINASLTDFYSVVANTKNVVFFFFKNLNENSFRVLM